MRVRLSTVPALLPAFSMAAGVLLWVYAGWVIAFSVPLAALAVLLPMRRWYVASLAAFCSLGVALACWQSPVHPDPYLLDGRVRTYMGVVDDVAVGLASQRCNVNVSGVRYANGERPLAAPFKCRVLLCDISPAVLPGDTLYFRSVIRKADDGGVDLPGMPDVRNYCLSHGITALAEPVWSGNFEVVGFAGGVWWSILRRKYDVADAVYSSGLSANSSALLVASTLGDTSAIADTTEDAFRGAGLAHMLCVSGFHVALIAGLVSLSLFPLRLWSRVGRWRHLITVVIVWIYAVLVGFSPPAIRASVMITAFLVAKLMGRRISALNTLAVAALVIMVLNPYWIFSSGFQLSFAAVSGILLFAQEINPVPQRYSLARKAVSVLAVSFSATLATAPVLAYRYHELPLYFLPANFFAALFFPLFIYVGIAAVLFGFPLLDSIADFLASLCRWCGSCFSELPLARLGGLYPSLIDVLLLIAVLVLLGVALRVRKKAGTASLSGALVLSIAVLCSGGDEVHEYELYVCSRGGTDELLAGGKGHYLLVPLGGRCISDSERMERYSDFIKSRRAECRVEPRLRFSSSGVHRRGNLFVLPEHRVLLLADDGFVADSLSLADVRVDVLVIGRHYKGDTGRLLEYTRPKTVVELGREGRVVSVK